MIRLALLAIPFLAAAQPQGAIEGLTFNKVTKAPIPGIRVRMTVHDEPARYYNAVSGADGRYRIENVPAGVYAPSFDIPDRVLGPSSMEFYRQRVQVSDKTATFDIPIVPMSAIRGRVLDPDKQPVAQAQVVALLVAPGPPAAATTDAEGRFSIELQPGRYHVRVRSTQWATTYYPNALDPAEAETVLVGKGADLGGYDIRLRSLPKTRIRGVVRDPEGKPARGVSLSLTAPSGRTSGDAGANAGPDGAFEFAAVSPGRWLITATGGVPGERWMGASAVTVSDRDLDGVELRIHPPFATDAEIEGLPKDRRSPLRVQLHSSVAYTWPSGQEKDGRARIERIYPGPYRAGVFGFTPGYYLKSILLGASDVSGRTVDLDTGSPPLRFVYAPNGGRATGEVEDHAPGVKVFFVSADTDTYIPGTDSFFSECDPQGRFTLRDLRPGSWYALAFASLPQFIANDAIRERVFGRGLWRQAQSFRVGEGETATLKLKIVPWLE